MVNGVEIAHRQSQAAARASAETDPIFIMNKATVMNDLLKKNW